jgi:twitching motility protein PilT
VKTLVELIRDAQARGGTGLRLVPGYPMELKNGRQWVPFGGQTLAAEDVRNAIWALLTQEEKKHLDQERALDGWLRGQGGPIRFQYLLHEMGLVGSFSWHGESEKGLSEWNIPPYVLEKVQRQSGLNLVTGPVDSGKSSFLKHWAKTLVEIHGTILFFSDAEEFQSEAALPVLPTTALDKMSDISQLTRFVMIDSDKASARAQALELASQGLSVFLTMPAKSIPSALMTLAADAAKFSNPERIWQLLGENIVSAFGLRLVPGLESGLQPAFELLVDTPEIKSKLSQGSVMGLVEVMAKGGDKSGMRTLNQALLQLLIKRRIELRTGFDESPNPLELDELLKKVGV